MKSTLQLTNKIGVIVDSLGLPLYEGLKKAKEIGADGVQIYAVSGDMTPDNMSTSARKELRDYLTSIDLEISALCGDLGGMASKTNKKMSSKLNAQKEY